MTKIRHTIRNIDEDTMLDARVFSVQNRQTLGETVTEALDYYLSNIIDEEGDIENTTTLNIQPNGEA